MINKPDEDVMHGRVAEVSQAGQMFKLDIEAVASRELRPWERHGPTAYWFVMEDYHAALPPLDSVVTLHLRPGTTTVRSIEIEEKPRRKTAA